MSGLRSRDVATRDLRVGRWRGDGTTALIALAGPRLPTVDALGEQLDQLAAEGFRSVLTSALSPSDQAPFRQLGFEVRERLHLLAHDLRPLPPADPRPGQRLRRARRDDRTAVIALDGEAFPPFWRLDDTGLSDALEATPTTRFRVAEPPDGTAPCGYAITGRAGSRGYLQRLAVAPASQGQGVGCALVVDGLRWARRWGAREVLVNTQIGNHGALRLYERLGFQLRPEGLAVLHRPLGGPA